MLADSEKEVVLAKLQRYCSYQDRCHQEVRNKLLSLKVYGEDLEEIIFDLIQDDYLNEERFARSFARGKFRIKKWGKNRIITELNLRGISTYCVKKGLSEIDNDEYLIALDEVFSQQKKKYQHLPTHELKNKIYQRMIYRGFESSLIMSKINSLEKG